MGPWEVFVWIKKIFKITFIDFLVHTHTCHCVHVEARGPLGAGGSLLPRGAMEPRLVFQPPSSCLYLPSAAMIGRCPRDGFWSSLSWELGHLRPPHFSAGFLCRALPWVGVGGVLAG